MYIHVQMFRERLSFHRSLEASITCQKVLWVKVVHHCLIEVYDVSVRWQEKPNIISLMLNSSPIGEHREGACRVGGVGPGGARRVTIKA